MRRGVLSGLIAATALLVFASSALALPNGGFGQGNLSKWGHFTSLCPFFASASPESRTEFRGGGGSPGFAVWDHYATSFTDMESGAVVPAPIAGHGVVFLESEPAIGVLHRTFRVPRRATRIQFRLWWQNFATGVLSTGAPQRGIPPALWSPATSVECPLAAGPQFIYVDLLKPNAPITSLASKYRLKRLWVPQAGRTPYTNGGMQKFSRSIKKFRGKRVKFRIAVLSTREFLNVGFDELRIR